MTDPNKLEGLKLITPPMDIRHRRYRLDILMSGRAMINTLLVMQSVTQQAQSDGMELVELEKPQSEDLEHRLQDPSTFLLETPSEIISEVETKFFETIGRGIPRPQLTPYTEYIARDTQTFPVLLAQDTDGGASKYVIENEKQLQSFREFVSHFSEYKPEGWYEVREVIPTPSNHYTTYRIVLNPLGAPLAAGLIYSDHTKDQAEPKIVEVPTERTWDTVGDTMTDALENPISPYFLNSRDICSNVSRGGKIIPLMGGQYARSITKAEQEILNQHGINPEAVQIPAELLAHAELIGKNIGRFYGMAVGLDFIQHADTGVFYFLESNSGPGGRTVIECWKNGQYDGTTASEQRIVLERSFASLALNNTQ